MELKDSVLRKMKESFDLGGDGILRYQERLCAPDVDDLQTRIVAESHGSRYSIRSGSKKMYHNFKQIYLWYGMKNDIDECVSKCPNCLMVNAEHLSLTVLLRLWRFRLGSGGQLIWTSW